MAANAEKLALPAADPSSYEDAATVGLRALRPPRRPMSDGWAARCSSLTELYEAQQTESWCGYALAAPRAARAGAGRINSHAVRARVQIPIPRRHQPRRVARDGRGGGAADRPEHPHHAGRRPPCDAAARALGRFAPRFRRLNNTGQRAALRRRALDGSLAALSAAIRSSRTTRRSCSSSTRLDTNACGTGCRCASSSAACARRTVEARRAATSGVRERRHKLARNRYGSLHYLFAT